MASPRPEYLSVRLIVWEGRLGDPQAQVKAYITQLKDNINESLQTTQWKYSRWKTYSAAPLGKHKLEVYIRHPKIAEDHEKNSAIHDLCGKLLRSDLATRLRLENPAVPFTFCPSKEGEVSIVDNLFARCFSVAVVKQYCVEGTQSEEMERLKGDFVNRNLTKYLHMPMIAAYSLASLAELYERQIMMVLDNIGKVNGVAGVAGEFSKLRETVEKQREKLGGGRSKVEEVGKFQLVGAQSSAFASGKEMTTDEQMLRISIAIAVSISRTFVSYAPEIKQQLKPMLEVLNNVTIKGRLTLASQAYIDTSNAPIAALDRLQALENATTDDIATTINSFGSLMQSTLPLFDVTLTISDAEFANIAGLSIAGGVGLASLGTGGAWLWYAGASAGPMGLLFAGGVTAVAAGAVAICESVKWGEKQKTNPSSILLSIQKTVEECCRFLLGLSLMLAEEGEKQDKAHLQRLQQKLMDQLDNKDLAKPGYMRAYYQIVSRKLEQDMKDLATGLRLHGVDIVMAEG